GPTSVGARVCRMLVQHRRDGCLRLFRQHDHALAAGRLAFAWVGLDRDPRPLAFEVVLATALHDLAWRALDRAPRRDPATRRPFAFDEYPLADKLEAYRDGLDAMEGVHLYTALLGSLHYTTFPDVRGSALPISREFLASEQERCARLRLRLGYAGARDEGIERVRVEEAPDTPGGEVGAVLDRELDYLRLFDRLSLYLCLTPPSAVSDAQPDWIDRLRHLETPDGRLLHLTWMEDDVLHVDPFPFREPVELCVPYRDLLADSFPDDEALATAWRRARDEDWWVSVRPAPRLA
ncbi:MAG: DUF3891 family protein, partial [Gemmatimonadota bacterium]